MTLSDLWPGFQGHNIFWSRISEKRRVLKTKLLLHKRKMPNIWNCTMFGDLEWPLCASRGFVSISWASCCVSCVFSWLFWIGCQYQCKCLTGNIRLRYDLLPVLHKGKGNVDLCSAYTWNISKALRYSMHCERISQFYMHTQAFHPQAEWAIPAFAFPAAAGTLLPTSEGWKAE